MRWTQGRLTFLVDPEARRALIGPRCRTMSEAMKVGSSSAPAAECKVAVQKKNVLIITTFLS